MFKGFGKHWTNISLAKMHVTTRNSENISLLYLFFFFLFDNSTWQFSNAQKKDTNHKKSTTQDRKRPRGSERWKYIKHKFQNVSCGRALCICIRLRDLYMYIHAYMYRYIIHASATRVTRYYIRFCVRVCIYVGIVNFLLSTIW